MSSSPRGRRATASTCARSTSAAGSTTWRKPRGAASNRAKLHGCRLLHALPLGPQSNRHAPRRTGLSPRASTHRIEPTRLEGLSPRASKD
eukprot:798656-Prymnesium_polylepis.1